MKKRNSSLLFLGFLLASSFLLTSCYYEDGYYGHVGSGYNRSYYPVGYNSYYYPRSYSNNYYYRSRGPYYGGGGGGYCHHNHGHGHSHKGAPKKTSTKKPPVKMTKPAPVKKVADRKPSTYNARATARNRSDAIRARAAASRGGSSQKKKKS